MRSQTKLDGEYERRFIKYGYIILNRELSKKFVKEHEKILIKIRIY